MQNKETTTSMLVVWGYVLLSMAIVASGMYFYHREKIAVLSEKSQKEITELQESQKEVRAYQEFLTREGREQAEKYFSTTTP